MPKKIFKKYSPSPEKIRRMKGLGFLAQWIANPNLWHIHRHSTAKAFANGLFWMTIPIPSQMVTSAITAIFIRASSAELLALISSISQVPLRQDIAVTGSVNQFGEIQPIGGVNEKIEGFFKVCKARGLTGSQGVIIPEANTKHLMLNAEVREAVNDQHFHLYAMSHIDDALQLLSGTEVGEIDTKGHYPKGSLNEKVMLALTEMNAKDNDH